MRRRWVVVRCWVGSTAVNVTVVDRFWSRPAAEARSVRLSNRTTLANGWYEAVRDVQVDALRDGLLAGLRAEADHERAQDRLRAQLREHGWL